MRTLIPTLVLAAILGLVSMDLEARRFGGGGFFGKQRAVPAAPKQAPAQRQAQPQQQQAAPANAAAAAPAGAAAKTGLMGRWGGMLAGLGIGVLLASLFGEQLGPIIGMLLMVLLFAGLAMLLMRLFANRNGPLTAAAPRQPMQFEGIGSRVPSAAAAAGTEPAAASTGRLPVGFDEAAFARVAKTSFIRMQAANDAGDLDDIRDFTTPEMYAEVAMQVKERADTPQRTEVVSLDAQVLDVAEEDGFEYASVRFWGLLRENDAASPEPFDEVWNVRKKARDRRAPWLIAGIQQHGA